MRLQKLNETEVDVWPAFTDFMTSVLLIVVIFVFGIFFSNIARSLVRKHSEFEDMQARQQRVGRELRERLPGKVDIPPEDGNLQRVILSVDEKGSGGVLFPRGAADLSADGKRLLDEIAAVLEANRDAYDTIQVEGHTDDVPVSGKYASNWELSAARAGAVVNYLLLTGANEQQPRFEPWRFSANGRAEFHPYGYMDKEELMTLDLLENPRGGPNLKYVVEANQPEGRSVHEDNSFAQRNRRIEIILTYKLALSSASK
jgi:flagellar motor protein MotB